jgi:hypothetical protein
MRSVPPRAQSALASDGATLYMGLRCVDGVPDRLRAEARREEGGADTLEWMESALVRHHAGAWRLVLLHSTRVRTDR